MKGLRRKVWTQTKIWSINIRYFVAILGLVAIETLLKIFGKKSVVFFKVKNVLDEFFMTISVLAERLPTSATLTQDKLVALIWCRSGSSGIKNFQSRDFRDGILQNPGIFWDRISLKFKYRDFMENLWNILGSHSYISDWRVRDTMPLRCQAKLAWQRSRMVLRAQRLECFDSTAWNRYYSIDIQTTSNELLRSQNPIIIKVACIEYSYWLIKGFENDCWHSFSLQTICLGLWIGLRILGKG